MLAVLEYSNATIEQIFDEELPNAEALRKMEYLGSKEIQGVQNNLYRRQSDGKLFIGSVWGHHTMIEEFKFE